MAKCLNCAKNATYNVKNAGTPEQQFCDEHLPKFYNKKNLPDHVTATDDRAKERAEAAANFEAEKAKAEAAVETPKPAKKKAVAEPKPEPTPEPAPEAVAEAVAEEPVTE